VRKVLHDAPGAGEEERKGGEEGDMQVINPPG
jgi:hypothetical protein